MDSFTGNQIFQAILIQKFEKKIFLETCSNGVATTFNNFYGFPLCLLHIKFLNPPTIETCKMFIQNYVQAKMKVEVANFGV